MTQIPEAAAGSSTVVSHARAERTVPGLVITLMRIGQHVVAVVLIVLGTVRAVMDGATSGPVLVIAAGLVLFAWYLSGVLVAGSPRRTALAPWWLLGFGLVWVGAVAVSAEFVWVAFVLWLLAGHLLGTVRSVVFSLTVYLVVVAAPLLHGDTPSFAEVIGPLIGGVFALGVSRGYIELMKDAREREDLVASLRRTQDELVGLQDELALVQRESGRLDERSRVARDLHDTVAQDLSSIRLAAHLGAENARDEDTESALLKIENSARTCLSDVRRIVAGLSPAELEEHALASALTRVSRKFEDDATTAGGGVLVENLIAPGLPVLPTEVEVALLRTTQSALANVRRHAQATRVELSLGVIGGEVRLAIRDDGRGFDPTVLDESVFVERTSSEGTKRTGARVVPEADRADTVDRGAASAESGFGIRFMRARLRDLGGGLDVRSIPGRGTELVARVPLSRGDRR